MTDCDLLIDLLNKFDVVWKSEEDGEIIIKAKGGPKQEGYFEFFNAIKFDKDGNFVEWGIWE
jgi:hypothetical protein